MAEGRGQDVLFAPALVADELRRFEPPPSRGRGWEDNDRFPVVFAALTMATMAFGRATGRLVAAGAGVTGYGLLYLLVHDVGVHGRLSAGRPVLPGPWLRLLRRAQTTPSAFSKRPYATPPETRRSPMPSVRKRARANR